MGAARLRPITVAGQRFRWRFDSRSVRVAGSDGPDWQSHDCLTVYLATQHTAPLVVAFVTWDGWITGGPLNTGGPLDPADPSSPAVNLHHPRWAALVIAHALAHGWAPQEQRQPFVIADGVALLRALVAAQQAANTDSAPSALRDLG